MAERDSLFGEISCERHAQDTQWGGPTHDDTHTLTDWADFIHKQNNLASVQALNPEKFEDRMVKVAALAIAAIESSRRRRMVASAGVASTPTDTEFRTKPKD